MGKHTEGHAEGEYVDIDIRMVIPDPLQPRRHFDEAELATLAVSLKNVGFVHPVVVRQPDAAGHYKLVVGERRWRAAQKIGLKTIPAIVRHFTDKEAYLEMQLAENLPGYRADWTLRERAEALRLFINSHPTMEAAAERLGRSPSWLSQMIAILELPPAIRSLLDRDIIRDRITLITLNRLMQRNEPAALRLIRQANEQKRLPRGLALASLQQEYDAEIGLDDQTGHAASAPAEAQREPFKVRTREKYERVANILGLSVHVHPEILLEKLMDEFLALKGARSKGAQQDLVLHP